MSSGSPNIPTEQEIAIIKSVAVDIVTQCTTQQDASRRMIKYHEGLRVERGDEYANLAYNILKVCIATKRESDNTGQRNDFRFEFKKTLYLTIPAAIIGGVLTALLIYRLGLSSNPAPQQQDLAEQVREADQQRDSAGSIGSSDK